MAVVVDDLSLSCLLVGGFLNLLSEVKFYILMLQLACQSLPEIIGLIQLNHLISLGVCPQLVMLCGVEGPQHRRVSRLTRCELRCEEPLLVGGLRCACRSFGEVHLLDDVQSLRLRVLGCRLPRLLFGND